MTTWTLIDDTGLQIGPVLHTEDEADHALSSANDNNHIWIEEVDDTPRLYGVVLREVA